MILAKAEKLRLSFDEKQRPRKVDTGEKYLLNLRIYPIFNAKKYFLIITIKFQENVSMLFFGTTVNFEHRN